MNKQINKWLGRRSVNAVLFYEIAFNNDEKMSREKYRPLICFANIDH